MAYVAVNKEGEENIYSGVRTDFCTSRLRDIKYPFGEMIKLPKGTIEKLIGKKLTWEDEPVELKENK